MSVALDKRPGSEGGTPARGSAPAGPWRLGGSTALTHLALMLLAYLGIVLLLQALDPFRASQLAQMAYYVPAVAGLTVLTGINGQISLGHGALMAVGAYTTAVALERQEGLPFLVVVVMSIITTCLVGALVGVAAARLHGPYLAGATLALAVGLPGIAIYFEEFLGGEQGLTVSAPRMPDWFRDMLVSITGERPNALTYLAYLGWALALLVLFLLSNLLHSRVGRQWRAVRDDEVAAELAGIDLSRARVLAFVVSAACAGLAGSLLAVVGRLAAPTSFTLVLSLSVLTAMVLGGLGSLLGAVIGSALLVFLQPFITNRGLSLGLDDTQAASVAPFIYGVVLVLVMLLAPRGLVGTIRGALLERKMKRAASARAVAGQ